MAVAYIDREGKLINSAAWKKHRADPSYTVVRQYDNGVVNVILEWTGKEKNYGNVYEEFHQVFTLVVKNYTADGSLALDPVEQGRTFPTEAAAVAFYEEFLTKWTGSATDEFGEFQEADNSLTPPPPPDPNRPAIEPDAEELGGVGAW
jgi:hypothetical protein